MYFLGWFHKVLKSNYQSRSIQPVLYFSSVLHNGDEVLFVTYYVERRVFSIIFLDFCSVGTALELEL
jgi:hypothetical protein